MKKYNVAISEKSAKLLNTEQARCLAMNKKQTRQEITDKAIEEMLGDQNISG